MRTCNLLMSERRSDARSQVSRVLRSGGMFMSDPVTELVKAHLKQLRLPAMVQELETLSRDAAASNQNYEQFLLRLTEAELAQRAAHALEGRIRNAAFLVAKDFDTYDFTAMP